MSRLYPTKTALRFLASFRRMQVLDVGIAGDIAWCEAAVDDDNICFIMERVEPPCDGESEVNVRHIWNPSAVKIIAFKQTPEAVWHSAGPVEP